MGTSGRPVPGGSPEPSQPTGLGPSPAYGYWISYSRIPPGGSSLRSPVWVVEELCPIRGLCGLSAAVWSWSPVGSTMPNTRRPPGPAVRQFPQRVWGGPGGGGVLHPLPFVLQDPNPFPQALRHKAPLATRTPRCTWALSTPGPVLRAPSHPDLPSRPLHFQQGVPEDLLFFYNHLRKGGGVIRVDQSLLLYRYHPHAATHAVLETTMWTHRVRFLEERVLPHWAAFTIWNAGRQGRWLYRSLTDRARHKVVAFCDVDEKKIRKGFYCYEGSQEKPKPRVPILHFRAARPPFVICVKLGYTPTRPTLRRSGTWTPSAAEVSGFCAGPQVQLRGSRPRRERVCEQADPEDGVCKDIHSEPHAAWAVLRPGPAEAGVVAVCAGCWLAVMQAWLAKLTRKGLRDSGCR
nr:UDP-GlcNAc:betaGal beta-1,3-N-acetylglucosaminyltransferase-like protein 1 isoform X4 [Manis javanica]